MSELNIEPVEKQPRDVSDMLAKTLLRQKEIGQNDKLMLKALNRMSNSIELLSAKMKKHSKKQPKIVEKIAKLKKEKSLKPSSLRVKPDDIVVAPPPPKAMSSIRF